MLRLKAREHIARLCCTPGSRAMLYGFVRVLSLSSTQPLKPSSASFRQSILYMPNIEACGTRSSDLPCILDRVL